MYHQASMAEPMEVDDGTSPDPNGVASDPAVEIETIETDTTFPYSVPFADSMIMPVLNPPPRATKAINGLRVAHPQSAEIIKSTTIRYQDIDHGSLPPIDPAHLPIPLDDPRRIYSSGVAGLRLTHPGGALQGGSGPQAHGGLRAPLPEQPEFVREFMDKHNISTAKQLQNAVKAEQVVLTEELRIRMRDREEANEKNRKVQERIDNLVAEREMERRVHKSAQDQRRRSEAGG